MYLDALDHLAHDAVIVLRFVGGSLGNDILDFLQPSLPRGIAAHTLLNCGNAAVIDTEDTLLPSSFSNTNFRLFLSFTSLMYIFFFTGSVSISAVHQSFLPYTIVSVKLLKECNLYCSPITRWKNCP